MAPPATQSLRSRQDLVLDTAEHLFYARGVHEVGIDELIRATGMGKASVYRLYPSKDELIAAWLQRRAEHIHTLIDADIAHHARRPQAALNALFSAVADDVRSAGFRGCAFNNASIEFADPDHPARTVARDYRNGLLERLRTLTRALSPGRSAAALRLADQLALIIDGMYTKRRPPRP